MSDSESYSESFSSADIVKVADRFGADLSMLAQASGAMSGSTVERVIHDVKLHAKKQYIDRISVALLDSSGEVIKARKYVVSTNASLWSTDRPGDNMWPRSPSGEISVVVHYTATWNALGAVAEANFRETLKENWGPSELDTNFPGMTGTVARRYASKAYGMERTDFE
ncbi:MAG TPA: hypothetical protein VD761_00655 [Solirubrobacterales bacterium]|nr:hypothetical protein [Solirubrobacterales bacterium]